MTGKKFERWTVLNYVKNGYWLSVCKCGTEKSVHSRHLRSGQSKSCGCLARELIGKRSTTHEMSGSRTYTIWQGMKSRCSNPNNTKYETYGGRGIKVCERWMKFENFLEDMGECPKGLSIDRIDGTKGYHKSNCKWSSNYEQSRNRRDNNLLTYNGETKLLVDWASEYGMSMHVLWYRFKAGWPAKAIIETPVGVKRKED